MASDPNLTSLNVSVAYTPTGAAYTYSDSFDTELALGPINNSQVNLSGDLGNDRVQLQNSTNTTITGGAGNDRFVIQRGATTLGGDVLVGGIGFNEIELNTSGTAVDLTGASAGTAASSGIASVVVNDYNQTLNHETVDLSFANLTNSHFTDGVAGHGQAFVALIGRDGVVNFATPSNVQLVGVLDGKGDGFQSNGSSMTASQASTLASEAISLSRVSGTLAYYFTNVANDTAAWQQALWAYVPDDLAGYVFTDGTKYYTIWTDGTIHQTKGGTALSPFPQPAAVTVSHPAFGSVVNYHQATAAYSSITKNAAGKTVVTIGGQAPNKSDGSIIFNSQAEGITYGYNGPTGANFYNLQNSAGGNVIYGTPSGDVFELGSATALVDQLHGQGGFNVVLAPAAAANVNLTGTNTAAGGAATDIQAVVGSPNNSQTVTASLAQVKMSATNTGVFEALLGANSKLTLAGGGQTWTEVATFTPSSAHVGGETALTNASELDTLFGQANAAESTMNGYLLRSSGGHWVTVWTDAKLAAGSGVTLSHVAMAQAMSSFGAGTGGATSSSTLGSVTNSSTQLIYGH